MGVDTRATVYVVFVLSYLSLNCNIVMCIFSLKCMMQLLILLCHVCTVCREHTCVTSPREKVYRGRLCSCFLLDR